jgi:hypothetical protein
MVLPSNNNKDNNNPGETRSLSGLVPVKARQVFVSASGRRRTKKDAPIFLFFNGGGTPVAMYVRLDRLLSKFVRIYFYDRVRYDSSSLTPVDNPATTDIVDELVWALKLIDVGRSLFSLNSMYPLAPSVC